MCVHFYLRNIASDLCVLLSFSRSGYYVHYVHLLNKRMNQKQFSFHTGVFDYDILIEVYLLVFPLYICYFCFGLVKQIHW